MPSPRQRGGVPVRLYIIIMTKWGIPTSNKGSLSRPSSLSTGQQGTLLNHVQPINKETTACVGRYNILEYIVHTIQK
jgi:hypothetical protein